MAERSQPGHQSTQPDSLPATPTQDETQDPSSTTFRPQISPQNSQSIVQGRRVSIQEPLPIIHSRRVSIQGPLAVNRQQLSAEDTTSISGSQSASVQDAPSITYSHRFNIRDVPPVFQTRHFSTQSLFLTTRMPLANIKSVPYHRQMSIQPTTQSLRSSFQSSTSRIRARVDVPPSITHSPEASIKSIESFIWTSQESINDSSDGFQINQYILENNTHSLSSGGSIDSSPGRFPDRCRLSLSQLPMGWRLLHEAKKVSRQLSLVLTLAGMAIIGLICLGQPWIHFKVPLAPLDNPAGFETILINTIFFVRCSDISCMHEYDQNAYLLDFAWAFLLIASVSSCILCTVLINVIFFTSSNLPMLDFSSVILSILTGTSMILGILFYLMQAHGYLQEGMSYKLGCSFYLAWIGVFLFLMTGFFSYLNYMNFWSLLAIQAIWT